MRRIKLITIAMLMAASALAQNRYPAYCDIIKYGDLGTQKNATLTLDFGDAHVVNVLDENGKERKYPSAITLMSEMVQHGWRLVSTYATSNVVIDVEIPTIHYIMEKMVSNNNEIKAGLNLSKVKEKKPKTERPKSDDGVY